MAWSSRAPSPAIDVGALFRLVKCNGTTAPSAIGVAALRAVLLAYFEPAVVHQEYARLPLNGVGPPPEIGAAHSKCSEGRGYCDLLVAQSANFCR